MSDIIKLLPDSVANQIAAGEVIQRPASAVKELLENSIDSGASEIKLIIKDAGKTLMQVIDNGCGMSETDARMSFERHATSKIQSADDLFAIRTMGFRGEALASIAAIAHVDIKSKLPDIELGSHISIEGSEVKAQEAISCPDGTNISVKNLFFNVPARRNFLKSDTVETRHIIEEFNRIALVNPDIEFSLVHNERRILKLPISNLKQRIVGVMGSNYSQRLVPVEQKTDKVNISGFIGKPEFAKKTRGEQYFFVNKRFIKHPYLNHAVDNAFQELLPSKAFPSYFIYFDIDPKQIDINIHPTKTEVNFQDNKLIYAILRAAIKQGLGKYNITPTIDFDIEQSFNIPNHPQGKPIVNPFQKIKTEYNPFETHQPKFQSQRERSNAENWDVLFSGEKTKNNLFEIPDTAKDTDKHLVESIMSNIENDYQDRKIFQIQNRFILTFIKSGVLIISQQNAHERILYERFLKMLENKKGPSQQELFPQSIHFTPGDAEIIKDIRKDILNVGFDIEEFGRNTFVVNGTPPDISNSNIKETLEGIIENYKKNMLDLHLDRKINIARSMAVNLSVKAGKKLQIEEMGILIDELFACQIPEKSPGGKSTIHIISFEELSAIFK
ncbi:MAG: DNA mismatch repair endonuclease MutL [Bacteroidales bacterium]|nr:DNA mismatch repair endonuclease MutL [Bacteroidales bacterium]